MKCSTMSTPDAGGCRRLTLVVHDEARRVMRGAAEDPLIAPLRGRGQRPTVRSTR